MKNTFKIIALAVLFLYGVTGMAYAVESYTDLQSFYRATLSSSVSSSATTINVSTAPTVTSAFLVIEPRTSNQEIVLLTSRTGTALTVVRGLSATSSSPVDAGYKRAHAAGSSIEIVDVHYYIKQIQNSKSFQFRGATTTSANLEGITGTSTNDLAYVTNDERWYRVTGGIWVKQGDNSETIGGTKTFSSQPQIPTPTASTSAANMGYVDTKIPLTYLDTDVTLTANSDTKIATQKATRTYVNGVAISGAPIANNVTTGIGRTATSTQYAKGYSSTTPYFLTSQYASSTASTTHPIIVVASSTGKIDASFIDNYNFGSGIDGDVIISASTTLTSDKYYHSVTITPSGILNTGGYAVYAQSFIINNGTIQNNGGAGGNYNVVEIASVGGFGGAGGSLTGGTAGANGATNDANGFAGTSKNPSMGVSGAAGGNANAVRTGGAGGSATTETSLIVLNTASKLIASTTETSVGQIYSIKGTTSGLSWSAPAGAGSGASGTFSSEFRLGGAGGGSGGPILLASPTIINTGVISSNGGNGGNGYPSIGGGGGGGAGGVMGFIYTSLTDTGTIQASGGTGGTGANSGTNGLAGRIYKVKVTGTSI